MIRQLYASDFERFGYQLDEAMPRSPAPVLSEQDRKDRDAEQAQLRRPLADKMDQIRARLGW